MKMIEVSEICHQKLVELGKPFETKFAFDEIYTGKSDTASVLSFLKNEDERSLDSLSRKLKRRIIRNASVQWTPTERLLISLRLSCATNGLSMRPGGSSSGSRLDLLLPTDRSTEALLWAVTDFWFWRRFSYLPYAAEYLTGEYWRPW